MVSALVTTRSMTMVCAASDGDDDVDVRIAEKCCRIPRVEVILPLEVVAQESAGASANTAPVIPSEFVSTGCRARRSEDRAGADRARLILTFRVPWPAA